MTDRLQAPVVGGGGSSSPGAQTSLMALTDRLPGSLDWGVLFRTRTFAQLVSGVQLAAMFDLSTVGDVGDSQAVALTSAGKCLLRDGNTAPVWLPEAPPAACGPRLSDRFGDRFALLPSAAEADCLAFGQLPGQAPVVLALTVDAGIATAEALFDCAPPQDHYELLVAVGVRYRGGAPRGDYWAARFSNRLSDHLRAAALAGFARTAHCNAFFLNHGRIDSELERGLVTAAAARVEHGLAIGAATAASLVIAARHGELAMTCVPPPPQASFPFGDLVPLGLLAYGLSELAPRAPAAAAAMTLARRHLARHRSDGLWAFHRGHLPTATDSALILLGHDDASGVEALERFADGTGTYLPQLSNRAGDGSHMRDDPATRHWCQGDFATTCLIRALRRRAGLAERTPTRLLEAWFERRAGLFFANPFLVDWAFALAAAGAVDAAELRARLAAELSASANADGSFGRFDQALSTALAIVALAALGRADRAVRVAQLRLLELLEPQGRGPITTPFYSSLLLPAEAAVGAIRAMGFVHAGGEWHSLSLYEDTHRMVLGAVAVRALHVACDDRDRADPPAGPPHPRYLAASAADYVERFALPPYLGAAS